MKPAKTAGANKKRKPQHPAKTWQQVFLDELRDCGNVRAACAKARVERSTVYKEKSNNDAFAEAWKNALDDALDNLESEAWRRARDGNEKIILFQGKPVKIGKRTLIEREYSDTLMALLLKAHRPAKYRERVESTNVNIDVSQLTDEQLERIARGEDARLVIASAGAGGTGTAATPTENPSAEPVADATAEQRETETVSPAP